MTFSFQKIFGLAAKPLTAEALDNMAVPKIKAKLIHAIKSDKRDVIDIITDKFPDAVNWQHLSECGEYRYGYPLFHFAVKKNNMELLEYLASCGANFSTKFTTDETSLQLAIKKNNIPLVLKLIELGADLESAQGCVLGNASGHRILTPIKQAEHYAFTTSKLSRRKIQLEIIQILQQAIEDRKNIKEQPQTKQKLSLV